MTIFYRFLRAWSHFDIWFADYQHARLSDLLATHSIDIDDYIVYQSNISIRKQSAMRDLKHWSDVLHDVQLQRGEA